MDENDRDFIKKIAKKADDAYALAKEARARSIQLPANPEVSPESQGLVPLINGVDLSQTPIRALNPNSPTQTWVQFDTPQLLVQHAPQITQLNEHINTLCRQLNIKELQVTYKR